MVRNNSYKFVWHKNTKYGEPITRTSWIDTAGGKTAAVNLFMSAFGNLKENTIELAEEYTRQGMTRFTPEVTKLKNGRWAAI
jgi:hypothetical protein